MAQAQPDNLNIRQSLFKISENLHNTNKLNWLMDKSIETRVLLTSEANIRHLSDEKNNFCHTTRKHLFRYVYEDASNIPFNEVPDKSEERKVRANTKRDHYVMYLKKLMFATILKLEQEKDLGASDSFVSQCQSIVRKICGDLIILMDERRLIRHTQLETLATFQNEVRKNCVKDERQSLEKIEGRILHKAGKGYAVVLQWMNDKATTRMEDEKNHWTRILQIVKVMNTGVRSLKMDFLMAKCALKYDDLVMIYLEKVDAHLTMLEMVRRWDMEERLQLYSTFFTKSYKYFIHETVHGNAGSLFYASGLFFLKYVNKSYDEIQKMTKEYFDKMYEHSQGVYKKQQSCYDMVTIAIARYYKHVGEEQGRPEHYAQQLTDFIRSIHLQWEVNVNAYLQHNPHGYLDGLVKKFTPDIDPNASQTDVDALGPLFVGDPPGVLLDDAYRFSAQSDSWENNEDNAEALKIELFSKIRALNTKKTYNVNHLYHEYQVWKQNPRKKSKFFKSLAQLGEVLVRAEVRNNRHMLSNCDQFTTISENVVEFRNGLKEIKQGMDEFGTDDFPKMSLRLFKVYKDKILEAYNRLNVYFKDQRPVEWFMESSAEWVTSNFSEQKQFLIQRCTTLSEGLPNPSTAHFIYSEVDDDHQQGESKEPATKELQILQEISLTRIEILDTSQNATADSVYTKQKVSIPATNST